MIGLEVEGVEDRSAELAPFTVAYVKEAKQHPNADRLRVCIVDTGSEEVQVVCGAPNARTGMKGVFAAAGSYIPGTGIDLKKGVIRGVESNGMLVSEREMGLSDEHEGIIDLPEDAPVGTPFAKILGLDDPVIEIAITPNRGDCLGVFGVARDLAATGLGSLKGAPHGPVGGQLRQPDQVAARPAGKGKEGLPLRGRPLFPQRQERPQPQVGAGPPALPSACGRSPPWSTSPTGDLRPGPSAPRLRRRQAGRRPDHAHGQGRRGGAGPGRQVLHAGLRDGRDRRRQGRVQGIGGVMGGELSGCTAETTNVFLEVALFDPVRVATTGRKLGILSDARYRFERGLDPVSATWGAEVAARLVQELCGGEASHVVQAGEDPGLDREITLRPEPGRRLGGLDLPAETSAGILEGLGFQVKSKSNEIAVQVPSWRPDVEGEADLVEEVLRIHGFDDIPQSCPAPGDHPAAPGADPAPAATPRRRARPWPGAA